MYIHIYTVCIYKNLQYYIFMCVCVYIQYVYIKIYNIFF